MKSLNYSKGITCYLTALSIIIVAICYSHKFILPLLKTNPAVTQDNLLGWLMAVLIVMVITTSLVVFIILILLGINALWNTSIQLINYLSLSKEEKRKRGLELKEKALKRYEWYKNMTLIGKYFQKELYYEKI